MTGAPDASSAAREAAFEYVRTSHGMHGSRRWPSSGECWFGPTTWQGLSAIRLSVSGWATTEHDVQRTLGAIGSATDQILGNPARSAGRSSGSTLTRESAGSGFESLVAHKHRGQGHLGRWPRRHFGRCQATSHAATPRDRAHHRRLPGIVALAPQVSRTWW
jgi:hypothetical protein